MTWTEDELEAWVGRHAVDSNGEKIGKINDVYMDDSTGKPEWLAITTGLFGTRISFVPLSGALPAEDDIVVAYDKALVKDSPNVENDGQLSHEEEERLYRHYGLEYRAPKSGGSSTSQSTGIDRSMLEEGSSSVGGEVSAETAQLRLRRREAEALNDIGLPLDDSEALGVEDVPRKNRP
jgi:sporulation protein YlmC with PRC-barrel domain